MDGSLVASVGAQCSGPGLLSSGLIASGGMPGSGGGWKGLSQCTRAVLRRSDSGSSCRSLSHSATRSLNSGPLLGWLPATPSWRPGKDGVKKNRSTFCVVRSTLATESLPTFPMEPAETVEKTLALPIDLYQVLGAETHFLADGIARCFESRVANAPTEEFSEETLLVREEILRAARDTLCDPEMRGQYNQGLVEDESGTIVVDIPWSKVSGALCILLEIGETEIVLQAGQGLLDDESSSSFRRDVLLAMALAHVDLSREALAQTPRAIVSACDHLDKALNLLQEESGVSFAPELQSQISRTLSEIRPQFALELLSLSLDKENATMRADGISCLRNILWANGTSYGPFGAGLTRTRDEFMKEAFLHMTALEQVELYTETPVNIPAEPSEVYAAALAHVAEGFVGKKPRLIKEADSLFLQLQQTNGDIGDFRTTDHPLEYSVERAMCALLLGEVGDCRAWLDIEGKNPNLRDPAIIEFVYEHSEGLVEGDDLPGLCKLLENWLSEEVFPRFREIEGLHVTLGDYYDDPIVLEYLESSEMQGSPLAAAAAIAKIGQGAGAALDTVKATLQRVFPLGRKSPSRTAAEDVQNSFRVFPQHDFQEGSQTEDEYEQSFASPSAGALDVVSRSSQKDKGPLEEISPPSSRKRGITLACIGVVFGALAYAGTKSSTIQQQWRKLVGQPSASVSTSATPAQVEQRLAADQWTRMDASIAEYLIRKWQTVKARALGVNHSAAQLPEILDGEMLQSWRDRANDVAQRGWFWEYTLLDLNIDSVTVSPDGRKAMVEATLQEYARLYDNGHPEHSDSYQSTYTTRYDLQLGEGGWRITAGAVLRS